MAILLNNVSNNSISDSFKGRGGSHIVVVRGDDFGGGTVEIQVASPNDSLSRFVALADGSLTENGEYKIDYLPSGYLVRAELTGATSPVNVFVDIESVAAIPPVPPPVIPLPPVPEDIDTWFDASQPGTITSSGGLVAALADPRGNTRIATQSNDSFKPETALETKNGLNVLTFGLNDQLTLDMSPTLSNEEISVYAVVKDANAGTTFRYYFDMFENSSGVGVGFALFDQVGFGEQGIFRDLNPSVAQVAVNNGNSADWNIAGGTRSKLDSHRVTSIINSLGFSALRSSPADVVMDRMTIGQGRLELVNSITNIAEIIVYNRVLGLSEDADVRLYLSNKWDISLL